MEIMLTLVSWIIVATSIATTLTLALAGIYDVRSLQRRIRMRTSLWRLRKAEKPHITVLIYNTLDADDIAKCLRSLNRCRYTNMDIVMIDNRTTFAARQCIRAAIPIAKCPIVFYSTRKYVSESTALYRAYKKSSRGDVIVAISPSTIVKPSLLRDVAMRQMFSPTGHAVKLAVHDNQELRIITLLPVFVSLSRLVIEKAQTVVGHRFIRLRTGYVFPGAVFRKENQAISWGLDADLCVDHPALSSGVMSSTLRQAVWIIILIGFLLFSFVIIAAATLSVSVLPLILSCGLLGFWLAGIVWLDDKASIRRKVALTFSVPSSYFLLLSSSLVLPIRGVVGRLRSLGRL